LKVSSRRSLPASRFFSRAALNAASSSSSVFGFAVAARRLERLLALGFHLLHHRTERVEVGAQRVLGLLRAGEHEADGGGALGVAVVVELSSELLKCMRSLSEEILPSRICWATSTRSQESL
jgi:hypothetical protein